MIWNSARISNHSFLPQLIDSNSIVVDLGAYDGDFSGEILRRFGCRVFAAEPVEELLSRVSPHPKLKLLPLAVGGQNQFVHLNVFATRCASVLPQKSAELKRNQPIEMVTLRELRRRAAIDRIDLLKIDIEGAEIGMFDDCTDEELRSIGQITVEFHAFLFPEQQAAVSRIRRRMADIGFWVLPFSLDSTDVLFLNRRTGVSSLAIPYLRTFVRYGRGIARRLRSLGPNSIELCG